MKLKRLFFCWLVVFAGLTATSVRAAEIPPHSVRSHAVELGFGSHFGELGGSYTYRLDQHWAATVGLGVINAFPSYFGLALRHAAAGGGIRYYPWGPLFAQIGASPLTWTYERVSYGPDVVAGVDLNRSRVAFTADFVLGFISFSRVCPSLDLGIGVNFGRSPDSRFANPTVEDGAEAFPAK